MTNESEIPLRRDLVVPSPEFDAVLDVLLGVGFTRVTQAAFSDGSPLSESPSNETDEDFVAHVGQAAAKGSVLATPAWRTGVGPYAPVPGQRMLDRISLGVAPLAILLPALSLGAERGERFRERVIGSGRDLLVLEADVDTLGGGVGNRTRISILVVGAVAEGERSARFFRMPPIDDIDDVLSDLKRLRDQRGGETRFGYVHRGAIIAARPLTFDTYNPTTLARISELRSWGTKSTLGSLFKITLGSPNPRRYPSHAPEDDQRILYGSSIGDDGELHPEPLRGEAREGRDFLAFEVGDVVVPALMRDAPAARIRAGAVRPEDIPLTGAPGGVIRLRPNVPMSAAETRLYAAFLRSQVAVDQVRAGGARKLAGLLRLSPSQLRSMLVPVPDESLLDAIGSIAEAEERLRRWSDEARRALDAVADVESPSQMRTLLMEYGRDARRRVEAAARADNLDQRVRTLYPLPVAFRWRSLLAAQSRGNDRETHKQVLEAFEHTLAFVACVGAASALEAGIKLRAARPLGELPNSRTQLSTWTGVLEQIAGVARQNAVPLGPLLTSITGFVGDEVVKNAIARLRSLRNDEAHLRTLAPPDLSAEVARAVADVRVLIEGLGFLTDYELIEVDDFVWDRYAATGTARVRALVGDHSVVPIDEAQVASSDIEQGSLYIRDVTNAYTLLRPYLVGQACPKCSNWSTFYLDHVDGTDVFYKSIEHGHEAVRPDLLVALRGAGAVVS